MGRAVVNNTMEERVRTKHAKNRMCGVHLALNLYDSKAIRLAAERDWSQVGRRPGAAKYRTSLRCRWDASLELTQWLAALWSDPIA